MKTLAKEKKKRKRILTDIDICEALSMPPPGHSGSGEWLNVSMTGLQNFQKKTCKFNI